MAVRKELKYKGTFESLFGIKGIDNLLQTRIGIDSYNGYGKTMLSYAAEIGNLEMTEFLYERGADANAENEDGTKPLHIATRKDHLNIVKFYISKGVSPNIYDRENNTPLLYLCKSIHLTPTLPRPYEVVPFQETVRFLVDNGADLNLVNCRGCTPLLFAAQLRHQYFVKLFLELGASVDVCNEKKWTVFHFFCSFGWYELVLYVLGKDSFNLDLLNQTTSEGYTPLYLSAENAHRDLSLLFISMKVNLDWCNVSRTTFLHCCSANGWIDIVEYLMMKECKINVENKMGFTPLAMAASNSHVNVIKCLISYGADYQDCYVDTFRRSLLHVACKRNWIDIVLIFIQNKCNLNTQDRFGDTPLHLAISETNLDIVSCMLKAGADCNLGNANKITPFYQCIQAYFDIEFINLFVEYGAYLQANCKKEMQILLMKELLKDVDFCNQIVKNQLNGDLSKIYKIPELANKLPDIEKMNYLNGPLLRSITEKITFEIQTNGYYNVLNAPPILLRSLCAKTIVKHYKL